MRWICWSRWGILKGWSGRSTGSGDPNTPVIHWRSQLQPINTSRSSENMWKLFFFWCFQTEKAKNKGVWWRHEFYQAVNPTKKVTPLISPMRLGEKTGMGRALGMPREFVGWTDCDVQPPNPGDAKVVCHCHLPCDGKGAMKKNMWLGASGQRWISWGSKKTWLIDDWVLKGDEWNSVFETKFLT